MRRQGQPRRSAPYLLDFFGEHLCGRTGALLAGQSADDRVRIDAPTALFG